MIRVTILGCGSSGGVPRIGGVWGSCDPAEPRNRRRRCALLIDRTGPLGTTRVLVDTGPDMVAQLLDAEVSTLDAVVWTHAHADHIHGIDDLRQLAYNARSRLPGYADRETGGALLDRFGYIFNSPSGSNYPPVCDLHEIEGDLTIDGAGGQIEMSPFWVPHGNILSLGLKIATKHGGIVYLPDVHDIPQSAWDIIKTPEIFICDALRRDPHPSHAHLALTLSWLARSNTARGVITNMHLDMDYATLRKELPANVAPAHDGMVLEADS